MKDCSILMQDCMVAAITGSLKKSGQTVTNCDCFYVYLFSFVTCMYMCFLFLRWHQRSARGSGHAPWHNESGLLSSPHFVMFVHLLNDGVFHVSE